MRYENLFIIIVIVSSFSGIIISLLNNNAFSEIEKINKNNAKEEEEDLLKIIKQKEDELKQADEERKKKLEEEIKELEEEEKKKKEEERKKLEEEKKKKEEEERKRIEEEKKKEEEEKKKKEEEERKRIEEKKKKEEEKKKKEEEKEEEEEEKEEEEKVKKAQENNTQNKKNGKLRIACAYALDNKYVFPTLVAMTSLAENAGKNTFYDIYVMINQEFTEQNKKILKSVQTKHQEHCEVIFINMGDKFKEADTNQKIPTAAYYRLELHNLLPNVNRIIWMDGDTAVFEDLTELITLDMKGNYIMGFLDSLPDAISRFNVKNATVLCSGVLLLDLDALRKNHMTEKFNKFIRENLGKINQHDQTIINVVCQKNIAPLPPKYGIWCFEAEIYALKHNERQRPHLRYNKQEFLNAYYHPAILHYVWPKPFWRRQRPVFNNEWWDYARKSGYYDDVYDKSPKWIPGRLLMEKYYEVLYYQYHYHH